MSNTSLRAKLCTRADDAHSHALALTLALTHTHTLTRPSPLTFQSLLLILYSLCLLRDASGLKFEDAKKGPELSPTGLQQRLRRAIHLDKSVDDQKISKSCDNGPCDNSTHPLRAVLLK